jgi:archaeal chaperonin
METVSKPYLLIVLAENAGMDPLDTQVQLRSKKHNNEQGMVRRRCHKRQSCKLSLKDIYEPLAVKEQVIKAATEASCMILRIDDVIAASKPKDMPKPGCYGGGPGAMGGGMDDLDM